MGSAGSKQPITPARPLRNKHLSHVSDPRSPTSGIPRTPIEVEQSSTRVTPRAAEEDGQEVSGPCTADPRSPTHGIQRTPLKPTVTETLQNLVKQLSQAFAYEDEAQLGIDQEDQEPLHGFEAEVDENSKPLLETEEEVERILQASEDQQAPDLQQIEEITLSSNRTKLAAEQATGTSPGLLQGRAEQHQTTASPEEVELAMGLLRLADVAGSVEDTPTEASAEIADISCLQRVDLGLPAENMEPDFSLETVEQACDRVPLADSDFAAEESKRKISREEEVELALGLLRLADVSKLADENDPNVLCEKVSVQTKSVVEDAYEAKKMPCTLAAGFVEQICISGQDKKAMPQEQGLKSIHIDAEEWKNTDAVPRTRLPSSPSSRPTGGKQLRQRPRKATGKVLSMSTNNGRSPLKILGDDNSPSTIAHRQVKRPPVLSESVNERLDSTSRPLKLVRGWEDFHNKENAPFHSLEN
ncbi:cell division cycle-associated protein 3 [Ambystoma mexicanum]|uniref:cell division cycle-associated protein 3 n=1 Tax=Ambystoma mexicanum TaxID=8296 RepID=UPI0037E8D60F